MHLLFEGVEVSLSPGQSYHLSPTLNQGLHCGSTNTFTLIKSFLKPPEKETLLLLCYFPLYIQLATLFGVGLLLTEG